MRKRLMERLSNLFSCRRVIKRERERVQRFCTVENLQNHRLTFCGGGWYQIVLFLKILPNLLTLIAMIRI